MAEKVTERIQKELLAMGEEKYRNFSSALIPTVDKEKVIGIRMPVLRRYAKKLEDYDEYISDLPHRYFEENNLHAFLIERETDFDRCIEKLNVFLPYVDNWATCDSMKPKVLKKYPEKLVLCIGKWLEAADVYSVRYGINLLMTFYLEDNFNKSHLELVAGVKRSEYYINMMRAWYFATALAKRREETLPVIENKLLDIWTHNKTIQKALESNRISKELKEYLKTMKIK